MTTPTVSDRVRAFIEIAAYKLRPGMRIKPSDPLCEWGIDDIQRVRPDLHLRWEGKSRSWLVTAASSVN